MPALYLILALAGWLLLAELSRRLLANPRGDIPAGLYWWTARAYARLFHHARASGQDGLRRERRPGPLIVVCNHTAGVDPVLVQAVCHFEPRWVMAQDMRLPIAEPMWDFGRIIFVDRQKGDLAGTREAVRHVKSGGVLGIFPEGRIERPARTLLPFEPGVGFIIRRCGAPVLPVIIEGTPDAPTAWGSLYTRGRARLRFMDLIDYSASRMSAEEIAMDLQRRYREWTAWPVKGEAE